MIWLLIVGSVSALMIVLWIFNRVAWGGGVTLKPYDILHQALEAPAPAPDQRPLVPLEDRESLVLRCAQCTFMRTLPPFAGLSAQMSALTLELAQQQVRQKPCPDCGDLLRLWVRRDVWRQATAGELAFSVFRHGATVEIEYNGRVYTALNDIPEPQQSQIRPLLKLEEEPR